MKTRADVALVARGLAQSREKAQAYIMSGMVYKGETKILKPSEVVGDEDALIVRGEIDPLASRGAHKLEKAVETFKPDIEGVVAMDIGAAAGGFTDVLLRNGARRVYAIDVGYGQLEWRLRNDQRVTVMERTNARLLTADMLPEAPTLTVMDVSFISIRIILPVAARIMGEKGRFITLIKPQFEAGRGDVGKHGVVRDEIVHARVLREIRDFCDTFSWRAVNMTFSPIKGPSGNIEFLADIIPGTGEKLSDTFIQALVREAHDTLDAKGR